MFKFSFNFPKCVSTFTFVDKNLLGVCNTIYNYFYRVENLANGRAEQIIVIAMIVPTDMVEQIMTMITELNMIMNHHRDPNHGMFHSFLDNFVGLS